MDVRLNRHVDTPCEAVTGIGVAVTRDDGGLLSLTYRVEGIVSDVRWPQRAAPLRTDGLWKHSCFEALLRVAGAPAYREVNLSPSLQWAAYAFDARRTGMRPDMTMAAPSIETVATPGSFELRAVLACPDDKDAPWHLGLSAVIEETSGRKSYWALAHPPGPPDFHHEDCFALQIPAASPA